MPEPEPESGIARAINSLWEEVEKGFDNARELASRPGVKKALVASTLGLATIAFLAPQDMTGRIRETIGLGPAAASRGNERLFSSADKGPERLLGATPTTKPPLRPILVSAVSNTTPQVSARAAAPLAQPAPQLPEAGESAASDAQSEAVEAPPAPVAPPAPRSGKSDSAAAAPAAPAAAPAPAAVVPAAGRAPSAARSSGDSRRLTAARGFSSGKATAISPAALARLGDSAGVRVQATEIRSSNSSDPSSADRGGAAAPGGESSSPPASASSSGKPDAPSAGAASAAGAGGGTGGLAENGAGPSGAGRALDDKRKCDESEKKHGPERDALFKRVKEVGDRRAAMGRTCRGIDCRQSFCDAQVCRRVWVCHDGGNPACVKTVCEPRRRTSGYQTYCLCSDLRCDFADTCRQANAANCRQMRACPLTAGRDCNNVDCSQ